MVDDIIWYMWIYSHQIFVVSVILLILGLGWVVRPRKLRKVKLYE